MTPMEQEVYGGIIVVVAGGLLTAGFKALQRGYHCLKLGHGEIMKANQDIAITLKGIEGRFGQGEQWMQMHHEANQMAFKNMDKRIDEVRELIKL